MAGLWSIERDDATARIRLEPFDDLAAPHRRALRGEAARLVRYHEAVARRYVVVWA